MERIMTAKPVAEVRQFNGGGSYSVHFDIAHSTLTEKQEAWLGMDKVLFDYQLNAVLADMKHDGFVIDLIK
jgi:hypothetical protein